MKLQLLAFLLFLSFLAKAQFSFEPNTDSTIFETPYDSTAIFQYKLIEASPWYFSAYLELTFCKDSTWKYKRVLISNIDNKRIELPLIETPPNIEVIWELLEQVGFLTLKSEAEATFLAARDDKLVNFSFENYQKMWPTDQASYVSEFRSKYGIRTVMYYNPIGMAQKLNRSKQTWYVPELQKAAFCYTLINGKFYFEDYSTAFKEYFEKIKKANLEPKKKRKRR